VVEEVIIFKIPKAGSTRRNVGVMARWRSAHASLCLCEALLLQQRHQPTRPVEQLPKPIDELLKDYHQPEDLMGEGGIFMQLSKAPIERCLNAEIETHLSNSKFKR
jgi:hypothetical protein